MAFEDLDLDEMMKEVQAELNGEDNAITDDTERGDQHTGDSSDNGDIESDRPDSEEDEVEADAGSAEELDDEPEEDTELDSDDDTDDDADNNDSGNDSDFEPITVRLNGNEIQLDNMSEVKQYLAKKNSAPTSRKNKSQQLMEQSGLSEEDIALMVDAKKGNKAAIAKLAKNAEVDVYDLDDEMAESYTPEFQAQYMSEVDEVAEEIMSNESLAKDFQEVTKTLPEDFIGAIASNPIALRNFAQHVESGLAQEVLPQAMKKMLLEGGDLLTHYTTLGEEAFQARSKDPAASKTKRKLNPRAEELKKQATKKSSKPGKRKGEVTASDIWDMSDEDFEKEMRK